MLPESSFIFLNTYITYVNKLQFWNFFAKITLLQASICKFRQTRNVYWKKYFIKKRENFFCCQQWLSKETKNCLLRHRLCWNIKLLPLSFGKQPCKDAFLNGRIILVKNLIDGKADASLIIRTALTSFSFSFMSSLSFRNTYTNFYSYSCCIVAFVERFFALAYATSCYLSKKN